MAKIVRVARTGGDERYLVQQIDLDKQVVHCWPDVQGFEKNEPKFERKARPLAFPRSVVEVREVEGTVDLWERLFEQARTKKKAELLEGDVYVERTPDSARFRKTPSASQKHPDLRCLCCGNCMRLRRLRTGASFYGCGSWVETGCNARWTARDGWNLSGTKMEGSERHGSDKWIEADLPEMKTSR